MDYLTFIRSKVGHDKIFLNAACGAILDDKGRVLLERRADRNMWGFPGGIMELGETFVETARREVWEETGLDVEVRDLIGTYSGYHDSFPNGDTAQSITVLFLCKIISGTLTADNMETLELKFFGKDEMPQMVNQQHTDMFHDVFTFVDVPFVR